MTFNQIQNIYGYNQKCLSPDAPNFTIIKQLSKIQTLTQ